jgi:hypothetical protein
MMSKAPSDLAQQFGGSQLGSQPTQTDSKPFLSKVGNFITDISGQKALGQDIGQGLANVTGNNKLYKDAVKTHTDTTNNYLKLINGYEQSGKDTTQLQDLLSQHLQEVPKKDEFLGQDKSLEQYAGDVGQSLLGLSTPFGVGSALKGATVGAKVLQGAKIGSAYGAVGGATSAMSENQDLGGVATNTAIGAGLGAGLGVGAEVVGAGIGKVAGAIDKSAWFNNLLPKTAARVEKQAGWVTKAQDNLAKEYQKALPLTPLQQAKEANLLSKRGDNVYTTLAKYNINVGDPQSVAHLQNLSDLFENATQHAQINEYAYFNLDEIKARAFADINSNLPSETARNTAKAKIENELDTLLSKNKSGVIDGQNGTKMINSDLVERLRRTGNSWTNFNMADPEKIGKSTGYALSNAVREQVDKQGTFPAYRTANSEWGKVIHAQKILNKIDASGKTFKTLGGLSGSIARKVLSGTLGYHTGGIGGAILSEMGTEYSAKILSNPEFRTYFDRKLIERFGSSKATPEAIAKLEGEIRAFIDNQEGLLQLPAGGVNSAPMFTPSPTTYEAPAKQINRSSSLVEQKLLPAGNPNMIGGETIRLPAKNPNPLGERAGRVFNQSQLEYQKQLPPPSGNPLGYSDSQSIKVAPKSPVGKFDIVGKQGVNSPTYKNIDQTIKDTSIGTNNIGQNIVPKTNPMSKTTAPVISKTIPQEQSLINNIDERLQPIADKDGMVTVYRASAKFPKTLPKDTYVSTTPDSVRYYAESWYKGDPKNIKVESFKVPANKLTRGGNKDNWQLTEDYNWKMTKSTPETSLINEAKKYKSAEEFVKKQKPIFHGTPEKFSKFDTSRSEGNATWFTADKADITNNTAGAVQPAGAKLNIMERYPKPGLKLATPKQAEQMYTDQLIAEGYAGVKYPKGEYGDYEWTKLFNPNKDTITKSQLTDIWNKANKK